MFVFLNVHLIKNSFFVLLSGCPIVAELLFYIFGNIQSPILQQFLFKIYTAIN